VDEVLAEFLAETSENLQTLDAAVLALEQRPGDRDLLRSIFRTIHTVKGTCSFLGLARLEAVAHAAENVLVLLRDGALTASPEVVSDVLAAIDVIRTIVEGLEATQEEPVGDDGALIAALDRWAGAPERPEPSDELFAAALEAAAARVRPAAAATPAAAPAAAPARPSGAPEASESGDAARATGGGDATLRVNVAVLDRLMNMVGELVLTRNRLVQLGTDDAPAFAAPVQQLDRVTADLQDAVMKTRMQPISAAWTKLPRIVRDLAGSLGKPIDLEQIGGATELDRQVLQAIQDPLTHLVRNAADHGIEAPAARREAGKSERGRIVLRAFHEGGHVVIDVEDDGAGIDAARVRRKAVERGLVSAEAAEALSDQQALRFIFEAGFSTAAQVTNVSGRGVGMDVVKSNIERIGGSVELSSRPGHGCTVRVRIPLTLAIVPALLVRTGASTFAIPQVGVVELVRVAVADDGSSPIVHVGGAPLLRLRETLLPLVRLRDVLDPAADARDPIVDATIVVCQVAGQRFGVAVDEVHDTQDIVVKPTGRLLRHLDLYAGCTILGDGHVIMILDAAALAVRARLHDRQGGAAARDAGAGDSEPTTSLLVFDAAQPAGRPAAPRAVPLALVSRLEEIPVSQFEHADGRWVVQYRDALLPVLPATPTTDMQAIDPRPVIVFREGERMMGLAVDGIRDIVDAPLRIERRSADPALLGVAVVAGRTTEIVDLQHFLEQARDDWFAPGADLTGGAAPPGERAAVAPRVLLVDDSNFFLGIVGTVVAAAGYHCTRAADGAEALTHVEQGERFDIVLSDIDMPHVDGFELARRLRAAGHTMPLVALTGRAGAADAERATDAGFDRFLTKLDTERLLGTLHALLHDAGATALVACEAAA
jgi:two-component system chemotaxis sensor kinase CheA